MTRDDIIKMAREAGFEIKETLYGRLVPCVDFRGVDDLQYQTDDLQPVAVRLESFAALVAAAEREACAKVCDLLVEEFKGTGGRPYDWKSEGAADCAYEIRARGAQ